MKIAYINGVCVQHDAISNAVRDEINWLQGVGHDVRLYAYSCEHSDVPFTRVEREADVAFDPHFQSCDLVVFHFGIFYPLFNLLLMVPLHSKRIVVFHNITPKELLPLSARELIERSFVQMANIVFADQVICDSETNRDVLHRAGIQVPTTVLPLAVHSKLQAPQRKPSFDDGLMRIAFLGRLVKSKGPADLLEAVSRVMDGDTSIRVKLDLVGNLTFSDESVVAEVRLRMQAMQRRLASRFEVNIHGNAQETEKQRILCDADVFVLPTYHEGFCVPVLEALGSGCCVVAYDNSNLPAISGGLTNLVPTGDVGSLASAISNTLALVGSSSWRSGGGYLRRLQAASAYVAKFNPDAVRQRYLSFISHQSRFQQTNRGYKNA
jgi:glycosyltransferase involved in cell wall biosynthesis